MIAAKNIFARETSARLAVSVCAVLASGLGLGVLSGWFFQIPLLVQIRPDFAMMQFMTAGLFLCAGLSLFGFASGWPRIFTLLLSLVPAFVSALLLFEYATGRRAGFDGLLVHLPALPGQTSLRPSLPTSGVFLLAGCALAILALGPPARFRRPAVWILGSSAFSIGVMAVSGYLSGISGTYVWGPFVGMALHTGVGAGVLSLGILFTQCMDK